MSIHSKKFERRCCIYRAKLYLENGVCALENEHRCGYVAQFPGHMALSRLQWCDYGVFLPDGHKIRVFKVLCLIWCRLLRN